MENLELAAEVREIKGKQVKKLRRQGWIPAVLYGPRRDPITLQVEERALMRLLKQAGIGHLISLRVPGADGSFTTLIREVQRDNISRRILHVDFQEVVMTEKLVTEVPIVFEGEAPVVERGAGVLVYGISSVEIECLPGDLIPAVTVDLSILEEVDQTIHVGDLDVPEAVHIRTDPTEWVVKVLPPRVAVEEAEEVEEVVEEEAAEVEVITEVKAEQRRAERPPEEEEEEEEEGEEEA
jgi:large subunit ribosomal protein L25